MFKQYLACPPSCKAPVNQVAVGDWVESITDVSSVVCAFLVASRSLGVRLFRFFPISVVMLAVIQPDSLFAVSEIPAVVVSALRTEQSTLTTPASITLITRDQIEASGARHISEVLRSQGGVQIKDLFGDGSRASVDMRGFGETATSNTLVLVDGRRLNNPDIAAPDLNSIALEDVERIEIVQGSAGVLFGDQAVGGVINVITRKPAEPWHSLKLSAGSYSTVVLHAATARALENGLNYRLSLDARESDNFRDHNEASYLNGFGKLGFDHASGSVFGELQYIDDELNTPGSLFADEVIEDRRQVNPIYANDFSDARTTMARFGLVQQYSQHWSAEAELTGRDTNGEFRLSSVFAAETEVSTQDRRVVEFTPRLIGFVPTMNDTVLTLGADVLASDYALKTRFGDQANDQAQNALYAQAVVPANAVLDVTLGVRYAEVRNDLRDAGQFAVYPDGIRIEDDVTVGTFGLAIKTDPHWRVLFRADQNYRFAKVDEYLQPVFTPTFTPEILRTQQGLSIETGAEWVSGGDSAKLLVYQLDIEDEIAYDPVNFANVNLDETRRKGVITSGRWQPSEQLGLSASYTFTDAEVLSGPTAGKAIPMVAKHSGRLSSDYRYSEKWQFYAEWLALSDRVFGGDFNNELARLPGYGVVNLQVEYGVNDFVLTGRVNNLLDKRYSDVGQLSFDPNTFVATEAYFPSPEINFMLTAAWQFR